MCQHAWELCSSRTHGIHVQRVAHKPSAAAQPVCWSSATSTNWLSQPSKQASDPTVVPLHAHCTKFTLGRSMAAPLQRIHSMRRLPACYVHADCTRSHKRNGPRGPGCHQMNGYSNNQLPQCAACSQSTPLTLRCLRPCQCERKREMSRPQVMTLINVDYNVSSIDDNTTLHLAVPCVQPSRGQLASLPRAESLVPGVWSACTWHLQLEVDRKLCTFAAVEPPAMPAGGHTCRPWCPHRCRPASRCRHNPDCQDTPDGSADELC